MTQHVQRRRRWTRAARGAFAGRREPPGAGQRLIADPAPVYTGTLTPERLDADYEAVFADGSEANSTLRLTRVP